MIVRREVSWGPRGSNHPRSPSDPPSTVTGERLTMADGSVWFHPYDGSRPTQVTAPGPASIRR